MIGLHVRLEHGDDRRTDSISLPEIAIDKRLVRIDDGELAPGQAAKEIRGAGGLVVDAGSHPHARLESGIALDEVRDRCYR
jgi:hypothetical protein